jgi:hypothetical protein
VLLKLKPGDKYWIEKDGDIIAKALFVTTQNTLVDRLIEHINSPYPILNRIITM